jgi:microcin C transport system substrate-binding protein
LVDKNGKPFEIYLEFDQSGFDRIHNVVAEDLKNAGIKLNIKQIDPNTLMKKVDERNFTLHYQAWGAILFPNPESSWHSKLADQFSNNNLPGFKNKRVDELCEKYNVTYSHAERVRILHEVDEILFKEHPYALGWGANYERLLYWNKFGHPKNYFSKTGDFREITSLWWLDPEKEKILQQSMKTGSPLSVGEVVVKPWG